MIRSLPTILAVTESEPAGPSNAGLGAVVLTIAIGVLLVWVGYLLLAGRQRRTRPEETPQNLQPYLSDDEFETNRVTRVLGAAVVTAAVLGISLPVYYINEAGRQARAEEGFVERDVEEGEQWWEKFECISCHGPLAGGGGAEFTEARSDLPVIWAVPSLNDVFFRFSEDEVRTIIEFGRQGTPMAPAGLNGGGAMTVQEVDQVITFLRHQQITQGDVLSEIEGLVGTALQRIIDGEATVQLALMNQDAERADILGAPEALGEQQARLAADVTLPDGEPLDTAVATIITTNGTCTDVTAALAGKTCASAGVDTDRDGIADGAELALTAIAAIASDTLTSHIVLPVTNEDGETTNQIVENSSEAFAISFDPSTGFTNASITGEPIADLDELGAFMSELGLEMLTTTLIAERFDVFEGNNRVRIDFIRASLAKRRWIPEGVEVSGGTVDYGELATRMISANGAVFTDAEAERAAGLFNAYCARCHTAGYNAGVVTEQNPGSGAWGPSLANGRAVIQFPDHFEQVAFIITGSDFGVNYGVNGLGSGRMPAFGQILSLEDIELIVAYERSL